MKKIFTILALCATMTVSATQYCHEQLTNGDKSIYLSCQLISEGNYQIMIEADVQMNGLGGSFCHVNENEPYQLNADGHFVISADGKTITCDIESTTAPNLYTPLYVLMPGEVAFGWPADVEWGSCGSGEQKTDPELSINETSVELDAANAETFQIVANRQGDGALSYQSANAGIASVSESGLVTAMGRGTTTITIRVAETDTYAAASKKLTVTVEGPLNWDAIEWLAGSDQKYKVVSEPEISSQFGGAHIENGNLWMGFPSAEFGDNSSVQHTTLGAGVSFPLSQFPYKYNTFNFICADVTYAITLFYVDGIESTSVMNNIVLDGKAFKTILNGHVVILKNGKYFNLLGTEIR